MVNWLKKSGWGEERFVLSFCRLLLIINYMLYVLMFDVLFDLGVR